MKAKLCLAIVVGMLLSLIAFPVLAGNAAIPRWFIRAHLAYVGRSSYGTDAVAALIYVRDANLQRVEGALVRVRWTLPGGVTVVPPATPTNPQGIARFTQWVGPGLYQLTVTAVDGEPVDPPVYAAITVALNPFNPSSAGR